MSIMRLSTDKLSTGTVPTRRDAPAFVKLRFDMYFPLVKELSDE